MNPLALIVALRFDISIILFKIKTKSPCKRKLDTEDATQSPSKRRPLADTSNICPLVDTNNRQLTNIANNRLMKCGQEEPCQVKHSSEIQDKKLTSNASVVLERTDPKIQQSNILTPENVPFNPNMDKNKSPRRMLLTKRALNMSYAKLYDSNTRRHHSGGDVLGRRTTVVIGSGNKAMYRSVAPSACQCFGLPSICSICMTRWEKGKTRERWLN